MKKVMDADSENILREINLDGLLQRLNTELLLSDPEFARKMSIEDWRLKNSYKSMKMGITAGDAEKDDIKEQTPEELAAQEEERERLLQESMQAEVINAVMRRIEGNLAKYDEKLND